MEPLRSRWALLLTGGGGTDPGDPDVASRIMQLTDQARDCWESMDTGKNRTYLWSDAASVTDSGALTTNYNRLYQMAIAFKTAGSSLEGSALLERDIKEGLDWMLANRYNRSVQTYSNWWHWEIGAPLALTDTVLLMHEHLSKRQIAAYMDAVDRFAPDPALYLVSRWPAKVSTGANRVWICKVIAIRSILLDDEPMLLQVRDALSPLFEYVTEGDGFYTDGSFIQHDSHPYTGGYGKSLLSELVPLLHLLEGTAYEVRDPNKQRIYDWVYDAFEPMMFRGSLLDMVSGREVSRDGTQNHESGLTVIGAVLALSAFAPQPHADTLKGMAKAWMMADTAKPFKRHASLYLIGLASELLRDERIAPQEERAEYNMLANMARAVHRRPGFAFGISMYSKRVSTYESINGEHLHGWYTAHGHTSLYDGDLVQYSDGYWPTVDLYRLAGTTVTNKRREDGFGHRFLSSESWTGGVELLGRYGTAGMMLEDYPADGGCAPLRARKSWFLFDDEVVALGTDISTEEPVQVETIVENRKLEAEGANRFVVNGRLMPGSLGWSGELEAEWMHLEGNAPGAGIGYYFPEAAALQARRERRTGRWSDIGGGPRTELARHYLTLWLNHGFAPSQARYAYVLLPGKSAAETESYARRPQVKIVEQSSAVHAVSHGPSGIVGANFWTDGTATAGCITCTGKAAVMLKADALTIDIAVSDPTHENDGAIVLDVGLEARDVIEADPRIETIQLRPTVKLKFHAKDARGGTASIRLRRADTSTSDMGETANGRMEQSLQ
ncbi:polysaccharide lyase 8 family protein [Paenibacillus allorhizosphaerae]|uniref:Xanthan lyase n=1 Tax=Paenibacillus allorhizosphaerae TaxID=2849866 RepID=A0ABN7TM02_9BACL|nr:polysaccharide lyase 8 family protein [Paenibacillus allorhizosphaerae]CAG7638715.1 Xanthan lyase [Paenibacillus allorhizosphaerae]